MSGRRAKKDRKAWKEARERRKDYAVEALRQRTAEHAAETRWRWLRGLTWETLRRRLRDLTFGELVRFFTSRCLFCGKPFHKRAFGHDCHSEVCMFAMMDRLMARRRAKA